MKTTTVPFLALLLMAPGLRAATHTWQGSGVSSLWSYAPNWTSGVAPAVGEANVKLVFPVTSFLIPVNSIPGLVVDDITITGGNYSFSGLGGGSLTFTAANAIALTNNPPAGATNTFEATFPIAFQGAITRFDNGFAPLEFKGVISGNGTLKRTGAGSVTFSGTIANTFSGGLRCEGGTTVMAKSAGILSFGGNQVVIGDPTGATKAELILSQSGQLSPTVELSLTPKAQVTLKQSRTQTIGALNMQGGTVHLEPASGGFTDAALALKGNIFVAGGNDAALISGGSLSLEKQQRVFTVDLSAASGPLSGLTVSANIVETTGGGGINKEGYGRLTLSGNNTFDGTVRVFAGSLTVGFPTALGSSLSAADEEASYVYAGARLNLATSGTVPETIFLNGGLLMEESTQITPTELSGALVISAPSQIGVSAGRTLTVKSFISGDSNLSTSPLHQGTLLFSGFKGSDFTGNLTISGGTVQLNRSSGAIPTAVVTIATAVAANPAKLQCLRDGQLAPTSHVSVGTDTGADFNGEWDLGGFNVEIGSLSGFGVVKIGSGVLTVGADNKNWVFSGVMTGNSLIKKGTGSLTIYPHDDAGVLTNSVLSGDTVVTAGTLFMQGDQTGHFTVTSGGTLAGAGSVGMVHVGTGGTLCLCQLKALGITGAGAGNTISFTMASSNALDQLHLQGEIQLNGTALSSHLFYQPLAGTKYTLIENDGTDSVMGTFAGLPEGAALSISGLPFTISYQGGDGNDIVLSYTGAAPLAPVITGIYFDADLNSVFLTATGTPGVNYVWEGSSDMKTWSLLSPIFSAVPDAQGIITTTHTTDTLLPDHYFFRLALYEHVR